MVRRFTVEAQWTLAEAELPAGRAGQADFARRVVTLRPGLLQAQRRCTLVHELVHVERGPVPRDPWLAAREEAAVEAETARRLIGIDALADALAWSQSAGRDRRRAVGGRADPRGRAVPGGAG